MYSPSWVLKSATELNISSPGLPIFIVKKIPGALSRGGVFAPSSEVYASGVVAPVKIGSNHLPMAKLLGSYKCLRSKNVQPAGENPEVCPASGA